MTVPKPPAHLDEPGKALWKDAWATGSSWLTDADRSALIQACDLVDERWFLREHVKRSLHDPLNWRNRAGLRTIEQRLTQVLHELGLTPKGRSNLSDVKPDTDADELAQFRHRVAGTK